MNIYNKLIGLLPTDNTDIGTVVAVHSDGIRVELQSGGYVRVKGSGTIGSKVYIKGGQVVGDAPSLAGTTIEI